MKGWEVVDEASRLPEKVVAVALPTDKWTKLLLSRRVVLVGRVPGRA
jgi:hypothetical protein